MSTNRKLQFLGLAVLVAAFTLIGVMWHRLQSVEDQLRYAVQNWQSAETRAGEGNWLADKYPKLREEVSARLGNGADAMLFITPDDPAVAELVQQITGGRKSDPQEQWQDTEKMYSWIVRNVDYAADTYTPVLPEPLDEVGVRWEGGFWRTPAETIRDKAGDCEDMSALLISMLLNYNERSTPAWGVGIESSRPAPARHIAVAIPIVNNQLTILDPTARYHTTFPNGWGIAGKDAPLALNDWLAKWSDKMPESQVYMVFSEDFYVELDGNERFLEWLTSP